MFISFGKTEGRASPMYDYQIPMVNLDAVCTLRTEDTNFVDDEGEFSIIFYFGNRGNTSWYYSNRQVRDAALAEILELAKEVK